MKKNDGLTVGGCPDARLMAVSHLRSKTMNGKMKDAMRRNLTDLLGDVYEDNLPLVAEIVEAEARKDDAYLVKVAGDLMQKLERYIRVLSDEE